MGKKLRQLAVLIFCILLMTIVAVSCVPLPWDSYSSGFPFGWSPFIGFPFGLIGIGLYFLPTIFAAVRHARSMLGIVLLNIFAGWTFIGWIIALVWSIAGERQKR